MNLLRRTLALVLVLLAILGLVASLGAVTVLWAYKRPLETRAIRVLDRLEGALDRAAQGLRVVRDTTARAREDLDKFKKSSAPDAKPNSLVMKSLARKVKQQLAPQVSDVHATHSGVTEATVVLGSLLEGADRLPLGSVGQVDTDELQKLTGLLGEVGKTSQQLSALIPPEDRADDPNAVAALSRDTKTVEEGLNRVHTASVEYGARVADLTARVATIHARLPNALQTGSAWLTVVLVWIAISQVIVVLYALSLWRRRSAE